MDEARLSSVAHSNRSRSNSLKLEHRKYHTNMGKNFFTSKVPGHQDRLLREVVESLSMEIFKTCLDASCATDRREPALTRGWSRSSLGVPSNLNHSVCMATKNASTSSP